MFLTEDSSQGFKRLVKYMGELAKGSWTHPSPEEFCSGDPYTHMERQWFTKAPIYKLSN